MEQEKLVRVREEKNVLISMSDGISLAADLYLPEGKGPFPALVNYYPYHKDDVIGAMTEYTRRYFAERGYAYLLVDLRGLGSSEGVAWEMLDPRENKDGAEIVEWIACQPWCDGNVGMWGISYGGITTLETASERPAHLKAIAPIFASVDAYHDFLYPGGCMNCLNGFGTWGSMMVAMNLMPPGYQDPKGRWYRVWKERLEKGKPHILHWQEHPAHDQYWQSRVVPVRKINVPTFVIGAWRDLFPETMVKLYEELTVPKKLFMGPWTHAPMDVFPFEPWDYLYALKRWWDYWLKGENNGIMDEPPVTLYVQGANIWRHEKEWPIPRTKERTLFLSERSTLVDKASNKERSDTYQAIPTVGAMAGLWDPLSLCLGLPLDQGPDDLQSLTYTTDPFPEDTEISGSLEAVLYMALESGEDVNLVAKLNDVAQNGSSSLITTGCLKGSHFRSHERPEPLKTGEVYEFRIPLWATSYVVSKGHRLRLSVSCSDFPRIWPTLTNPMIRLFFSGAHASFIRFPVVPPLATPMERPEIKRPDPTVNRLPCIIDAAPLWKIEQDLATGKVAVVTGTMEQIRIPTGGKLQQNHIVKASVSASQPDGAKVEGETTFCLDLPAAGLVEVESKTLISQTGILITGKVTVNGKLFFEKQWQR